jgi:uncharacterized membrane protein
MFDFLKRKPKDFFTDAEEQLVVDAIRQAERRTSGEVRVFIESRCRFVDALDRAAEVFWTLKMDKTENRNAVLVYVALKDHQLAVFGDEGIHAKVTSAFWNEEVRQMLAQFKKGYIPQGIAQIVNDIGEALHTHFPYDEKTDKNELPDEIVFGD